MAKKAWDLNAKLKQAIRKVWSFSPMRREALKAAQTRPHWYKCAICTQETERPFVDHISAVALASDWSAYVKAMFEGELQIVCRSCHSKKTKVDLKKIKDGKRNSVL